MKTPAQIAEEILEKSSFGFRDEYGGELLETLIIAAITHERARTEKAVRALEKIERAEIMRLDHERDKSIPFCLAFDALKEMGEM